MKKVFCFGEILLRMSPEAQGGWIKNSAVCTFLGGAELNVATALANWNIPVQYCSAAPDNLLTHEILQYFQQRNIDTSQFLLSGNRIGLYYLQQGADLKNASVIYDRAHSSFSEIQPNTLNWKAILKDAEWFHFSAISPAISSNIAKVCKEALEVASAMGLKISVDLNYRSKLWQYTQSPPDVMKKLVSYCDIVMGNIWSAQQLLEIPVDTNIKNDTDKSVLLQYSDNTAAIIFQQYPKCKIVANTFRLDTENGVRYFSVINDRTQNYSSKEFQLQVVDDKAGSGDCFMAGLIYGHLKGFSSQETVEFAAKAAVGKMLEIGDSTKLSLLEVHQIEARMNRNKNDISQLIFKQGVIPLFYHQDKSVCIEVVDALYKGGIRIIEFTNRGINALENFKALVQKRNETWPDLYLSAGTIKSEEDAQNFIAIGADFIISPGVIPAVAKLVQSAGLLWIPGCLTPTEIITAEQNGAVWVKIFPGNLLGPSFIKGIKELFPNLKFMPTGGVELTEENLSAWLKAGASAVGLGSKVISEDILARKDYQQIENLARKAMDLIQKLRA